MTELKKKVDSTEESPLHEPINGEASDSGGHGRLQSSPPRFHQVLHQREYQ
jgi:hypothetical protein